MLVVDTYNVLHQTGVLSPDLAGIELPDLVWLIEQSRHAGRPALLVCDGVQPGTGHTAPSTTRIHRARVLYAGAGREADAEIERIIQQSSAPTRLTVVSTDKRVRRAARRRRAAWIRSEAFLRQLEHDLDRARAEPMPKWVHEIPLDPSTVAHWIRLFGVDTNQPETQESQAAEPSPLGRDPGAEPRPPGDPAPDNAPPSEPTNASPEPDSYRRDDAPPDPELTRLLDEHADAIDPDELDMRRWLDRDA